MLLLAGVKTTCLISSVPTGLPKPFFSKTRNDAALDSYTFATILSNDNSLNTILQTLDTASVAMPLDQYSVSNIYPISPSVAFSALRSTEMLPMIFPSTTMARKTPFFPSFNRTILSHQSASALVYGFGKRSDK